MTVTTPTTHAPETGALNRLHFFLVPVSGTCVMQIWDRIGLVPEFGRRLEQRSIHFQARKWRVHDWNGDLFSRWLLCSLFLVSCCVKVLLSFINWLFIACATIVFGAKLLWYEYTKNRRQKPAGENEVDLTRRFLDHVRIRNGFLMKMQQTCTQHNTVWNERNTLQNLKK